MKRFQGIRRIALSVMISLLHLSANILVGSTIRRFGTRVPCRHVLRLVAGWLFAVAGLACLIHTSHAQSLDRPSVDNAVMIGSRDRYDWTFERENDTNEDAIPDDWKRRETVGYPNYVVAKIQGRDPEVERKAAEIDASLTLAYQEAKRYLGTIPVIADALPPFLPSISDQAVNHYYHVEMDGGRFQARSPIVPAGPTYQYQLRCDLMCRGLHYDSAFVELVFVDSNGIELDAKVASAIRGSTPWTTKTIRSIRAPQATTGMFLRVNVVGDEDGLEDINAIVGFDNLVIQRFPQLQIRTDRPFAIYRPDEPVVAVIQAMGVEANAKELNLVLMDHEDRVFAETVATIDHSTTPPSTSWALGELSPGYYRINASVASVSGAAVNQEARRRYIVRNQLGAETSFAVLNPMLDGPAHGPFGWSLAAPIDDGISPRDYADYLNDSAVTWMKYPCWIEADDTRGAERLTSLLGKLSDEGIRPVGRLDHPPVSVPGSSTGASKTGRNQLVAAAYFRDVATWQPELEPVMNRLTLKVRTWQLGADHDFSFLGQGKLKEQVSAISAALQGFGQPLDIAISWPWLEETLSARETSWQAVCRSSDPPLSADELSSALRQVRRSDSNGPETWVTINPIAKDRYDTATRAADLALRMAAVRSHRVAAAFISDPHDDQAGILSPDGAPGELYLPWRTTARLLGNRRYAGSLRLPSGANNQVFAGADSAVWMAWAPEPIVEEIYLGEDVQQIDLWGRSTQVPEVRRGAAKRQQVSIGPTPTFLVGCDPVVMQFRMSVELPRERLDSLPGQMQPFSVQFTNPMNESLVGNVRVEQPRSWQVPQGVRSWELLSGRSTTVPFEVVLSNTAQIGGYQVPLQFELETTPPKFLTVHRQMQVGPQGLIVTASTKLLRSGEIRVLLEMTNLSDQEQSYDCLLFPPPHLQFQMRFITIPPGGTSTREFIWPGGKELIGKRMLLRAVEKDGNRVLNYPIDLVR